MKRLQIALFVAGVVAGLFAVQPASAGFIDPLNTTSNLFPNSDATAINNFDGTVSLARVTTSSDAVVDWRPGGGYFPLQPLFSEVNIFPTAQHNAGGYGAWVLHFNASDIFLSETNVVGFTTSTASQTFNALTSAPATSAKFFVRFRLDELGANSGMTFTEFQAVPEPAGLVLLALAALPLMRRR